MVHNINDRIEHFLSECKNATEFVLINREKNMAALAEMGLTFKNCRDIILDLSVENYHDGPLEDNDRPGEIWVFGKETDRCELYIKLKLVNSTLVKCISFHRAEHPLDYPCKKVE
jgi:hypothetical protein